MHALYSEKWGLIMVIETIVTSWVHKSTRIFRCGFAIFFVISHRRQTSSQNDHLIRRKDIIACQIT